MFSSENRTNPLLPSKNVLDFVIRKHDRPLRECRKAEGTQNGRMISIDCTGVEDALDVTMAQRSELDYLIYNDPLGYADLILNGDPEKYLKTVTGNHGLED